ncbi:MAG: hypothetical protein JNJ61_01595 [Anaerolineae bacterium]|nr:hypothetical protein [Anaerolineae bacterium]
MSAVLRTPYQEFAEFVTSSPTLEQIVEYRLSDANEAYISSLLEGNRNGTLTPEELQELQDYTRLEHLMRLVKIRAYEKLAR